MDFLVMLIINGPMGGLADRFFYNTSSKLIWLPVILSIVYTVARRSGNWKKALMLILIIIAVCALCDQTAGVIKRSVERFRPSHTSGLSLMLYYINGYHGGRYGFVSAHAANCFGMALYLSLLFNKRFTSYTLFITAVLVSFSRIYLGVHFPGDILGGACLGILIGFAAYALTCHFLGPRKRVTVADPYSAVPVTMLLTIAVILVISALGVTMPR